MTSGAARLPSGIGDAVPSALSKSFEALGMSPDGTPKGFFKVDAVANIQPGEFDLEDRILYLDENLILRYILETCQTIRNPSF
jgi:hypothetical protein